MCVVRTCSNRSAVHLNIISNCLRRVYPLEYLHQDVMQRIGNSLEVCRKKALTNDPRANLHLDRDLRNNSLTFATGETSKLKPNHRTQHACIHCI